MKREIRNVSLQEAREHVREVLAENSPPQEIVVHIPEGIYKSEEFVFTDADCSDHTHIRYEADGNVIIHGGLSIPKECWKRPDKDMAARFAQAACDHICMVDLFEYGLSEADWGAMQAIGAYETSAKYTDVPGGSCCQVFCGDKRMSIARYPNEGYLELDAIADVGEAGEFPNQNYYKEWDHCKDPRGGIYIIDRETNARIMNWKDADTAWMFGYFYWDWADSSTPIAVDTEHRRVFPRYVSRFGAKAGGLYYLYNVPEELDTEGEWYLDRKSAKLYFYPPKDAQTIDFCWNDKPLISCSNVKNLTFSGLTLQGTMGDAISCQGDSVQFLNLEIKGIGGTGIVCEGKNNLVEKCDISHTGRGGVYLSGGCRKKLIPGNNRVTNCYIHEFSEVYQTYQPGVMLEGVGNQCDHNEIAYTPHFAIWYKGNEHLIEYNHIHHAVLMSSDAGAIYAGFDWAANGCVIRYNRIEHIGANGFEPHGIYWDDGHSGQTAYGNLLIHIKKDGFLVGGGRENVVKGNVIIDCEVPVQYDDRNREGFVRDGWARAAVNTPDAKSWRNLREVPFDTEEIWKQKYPRLAKIITDFTKCDEPDFPVNPSYSEVCDNIIIHTEKLLGAIYESVYEYSCVENNLIYSSESEAGFDTEKMRFTEDSPVFEALPEFVNLPIEQMGRILCGGKDHV